MCELRLIELIRNVPLLYDPMDKDYWNRFKRDEAWREVADGAGMSGLATLELIQNPSRNDYNRVSKLCTVTECKKKWLYLRRSYSSNMKRKNNVGWWLERHLNFLEPHIKFFKERWGKSAKRKEQSTATPRGDDPKRTVMDDNDIITISDDEFYGEELNNVNSVGPSDFSVNESFRSETILKVETVFGNDDDEDLVPVFEKIADKIAGVPKQAGDKGDKEDATVKQRNTVEGTTEKDTLIDFFMYIADAVKALPPLLQADVKSKCFAAVNSAELSLRSPQQNQASPYCGPMCLPGSGSLYSPLLPQQQRQQLHQQRQQQQLHQQQQQQQLHQQQQQQPQQHEHQQYVISTSNLYQQPVTLPNLYQPAFTHTPLPIFPTDFP